MSYVLQSGYQIFVVIACFLENDEATLTELSLHGGCGFGMRKGMETMMNLNAPKVTVSRGMNLELQVTLLTPSKVKHKRKRTILEEKGICVVNLWKHPSVSFHKTSCYAYTSVGTFLVFDRSATQAEKCQIQHHMRELLMNWAPKARDTN